MDGSYDDANQFLGALAPKDWGSASMCRVARKTDTVRASTARLRRSHSRSASNATRSATGIHQPDRATRFDGWLGLVAAIDALVP
jgi:hypothetical protein